MSKLRETSTDKDVKDLGTDFIDDRKPDWVDHAHLDAPLEESLANRLIYKPALRFHGLTGGLWGAKALSDTPSIPSDRPPSYKMVESMKARSHGSSYSDTDTVYNSGNISAMSPLTLRRRNTVAVVLVAIALLAAAATITGVTLHFLHPKGLLRANVRFTIANRNFTEGMINSSSMDFHEIEKPLCEAMDEFFLTSELADFYLGCKVVTLRNDVTRVKNGTAVHYNLDFIENAVSNDGDRIKKIIMRRSGRHKTDDTLYLVIRDFLVYLRSLRIDLEVLPLPDDHPGRRRQVKIPWNLEIDFIPSKSGVINNQIINVLIDTKPLSDNLAAAKTPAFDDDFDANVHRLVLPGGDNHDSTFIEATPFYWDVSTSKNAHALHLSKNFNQKSVLFENYNNMFVQRPVTAFNKRMLHVGLGFQLTPTKSSIFSIRLSETDKSSLEHLYLNSDSPVSSINLHQRDKQANRMVLKDAFDSNTLTEKLREFQHEYSQLQTSFDDIATNEADMNNIATEELFRKTIEIKSRPMRSANSSPSKMTTYTSGMYIIRGSKTNSSGKKVTGNEKLNSKAIYRHAPFNNVQELNEVAENGVLIKRADARRYHFKSSVITTPIDNSVLSTSVSDTVLSVSPESSFELNSISSIAELIVPADEIVFNADNKLQMNEFVNVLPEREPINNSEGHTEWINLFNEQKVTDSQSLTEISHTHRENEDPLDLIIGVDSNNLPSETEWINIFNQPKIATIQYVGDLGSRIQSDNTKKINLEGFSSIEQNRNENDVIVVVRDTKPIFTALTNTGIPFDITHRFIHSPKQTLGTSQNEHHSHKDKSRNKMEEPKRANNLQKTQYQNKFAPDNQVIVQLRDSQISPLIQTGSKAFNSDRRSRNEINSIDIPKFKVIRQIIDGRPVLMLLKAGSGEEQSFSEHRLSDPEDRQTWNFLQRIGMNLTTSDVFMDNGRALTMTKQLNNNRNLRSGGIMFRRERQTRSDVPNSKLSFWRKSNAISGRQRAIENDVRIGRKENNPIVQRSSNTVGGSKTWDPNKAWWKSRSYK